MSSRQNLVRSCVSHIPTCHILPAGLPLPLRSFDQNPYSAIQTAPPFASVFNAPATGFRESGHDRKLFRGTAKQIINYILVIYTYLEYIHVCVYKYIHTYHMSKRKQLKLNELCRLSFKVASGLWSKETATKSIFLPLLLRQNRNRLYSKLQQNLSCMQHRCFTVIKKTHHKSGLNNIS